MKKNTWRYHHFTKVYQKLLSDDQQFLRYGVQWTDGRMDRQMDEWMDGRTGGRTEKVTYRGGCPT